MAVVRWWPLVEGVAIGMDSHGLVVKEFPVPKKAGSLQAWWRAAIKVLATGVGADSDSVFAASVPVPDEISRERIVWHLPTGTLHIARQEYRR